MLLCFVSYALASCLFLHYGSWLRVYLPPILCKRCDELLRSSGGMDGMEVAVVRHFPGFSFPHLFPCRVCRVFEGGVMYLVCPSFEQPTPPREARRLLITEHSTHHLPLLDL